MRKHFAKRKRQPNTDDVSVADTLRQFHVEFTVHYTPAQFIGLYSVLYGSHPYALLARDRRNVGGCDRNQPRPNHG